MPTEMNYREPVFNRYAEPEVEKYDGREGIKHSKQGLMKLCEEQEKNLNVLMEVITSLEQRLTPITVAQPEPSNRNMSTSEGDYNNNSNVIAEMITHQAIIRRIIERVASLRDNAQI